MAMLVYEERLVMPSIELLFEELTELKIVKQNRVDHPRKLSKDLADAVCGAIFGAIAHTPKDMNQVVEIHTFKERPKMPNKEMIDNNVITYQRPPQKDLDDYFDQFDIKLV
jgi:hypothetical protein